jgi:hypothetical protein
MPLFRISPKIRNDLLGPGTLANLSTNLRYVRRQAALEHIISTGEHNAWQVPRRVVTIDAAGTTISPTNSDVIAVSNPAVGRYVLTLAGGRFTSDIRVQLNVNGDQIRSKPCIAGYQVLNSTTVEVYIKQLSSALGAGNAWAADNCQFDIALHSEPLPAGSYAADGVGHARGDTLTDVSTDWDATAQAHGDMEAMLTAAHSSAGAHQVQEVARWWARATYRPSGTTYDVPEASSGVTVTRVSAGVVQVNYAALKVPMQAFVCPDYQRTFSSGTAADLYVMNAERNSTTQHTVYIYKYDGTNWSVDDADFFMVVHGVP